jgi:hypothetical protein
MAGKLTSHGIKEFLDLKGIKCNSRTFFKNVYGLSYNCTLQLFNEITNEDCEESYDWMIRFYDGDEVTIIDNNEFFGSPMTKEELFAIIETEYLKGKLERL